MSKIIFELRFSNQVLIFNELNFEKINNYILNLIQKDMNFYIHDFKNINEFTHFYFYDLELNKIIFNQKDAVIIPDIEPVIIPDIEPVIIPVWNYSQDGFPIR